jgi:murein L,D-transpeptidase YcbB/YkuD
MAGAVALVLLAGAAPAAVGQPADQVPAAAPARGPSAPASLRPDQISLLELLLSSADTEGLKPDAFLTPAIEAKLRSRDLATWRNGEAELISATLDYARAVHSGRLPADAFLADWALRPAAYDPTAEFAHAVAQDRLAVWLDGLPPHYPGYDGLRRALATYRAIAVKGGWPALAPGPVLKEGAAGPRVRALKARLVIEDSTIAGSGPARFDRSLASAVVRAQQRFGLEPSGQLNEQTLDALNVPVERRIAQIEANMERWRWLPRELPADRIELNIGSAIVTVFQKGAPVLSMRAIAGRPGDTTATPIMQSQVDSIVFNPPWDVPDDIATKELWPKEHAHPGFLAHANFIVIPAGDGQTHLQQKAGSYSAMGKLMFELPNPYGVYLHDTPSRALFDHYSRLASHGCVRLEDPLKLADLVMAGDPNWTPEAITKTIAAGDTVRAPVQRPLAIFLLYWTADVGPDGQTNLRNDPYGWDAILMQRLDAADHGVDLTHARVASGDRSAAD